MFRRGEVFWALKKTEDHLFLLRFIAPPGHHIRAHAITVDLEPPHDRLFFLEGADALRGRHLDTSVNQMIPLDRRGRDGD